MLAIYHKKQSFSAPNIPNYVRILPVKNKNTGINHGTIPPEAKSKGIDATIAHAQITNASQRIVRNSLHTKLAKSCRDTTCQNISRMNKRHQTYQWTSRESTIFYSNKSLADKRMNRNAEYNVRKCAQSHTEASSASAPRWKHLWLPTCR